MAETLHLPDHLTVERFLADHWQHKPLLMRGALPGFRSPLSADELAGLACEPEIESRLVLERGVVPWEVRNGPFDEAAFAALPATHWTLLVQDVDKRVPEVAELLDAFDFIPDWRLDDIMISYAEDQGSVGPHVDEYDVFLIQAEGRRRWRIDSGPAPDTACIPGLDLGILEHFEPREQWVLEPGDILYLPPGVPHWGIAEGPCMTWSVGMRAPDWQEMATAWCDAAIARYLPRARYRDPGLTPPRHRGEIPADVLAQVRGRIQGALLEADDESFASWFGTYICEPKEHLEPFPRDEALGPSAFREALMGAGALHRGTARLLFTRTSGGDLLLFSGGQTHRLPGGCIELAALITAHRVLDAGQLAPWLDDQTCLNLLCTLYNQGHYDLG